MSRRSTAAAVRIVDGQITTSPATESTWLWGPKFEGGAWIIQTGRYVVSPWAIRVVWDDSPQETCQAFDTRLERVVWEAENPGIVDALAEAEPSTIRRIRPRPRPGVPDVILEAFDR